MKNTIRCCISCILPCGALDVIRIVHSNGRVEEISGSIKAADVMKAYPNHVLKKPCSPSSANDDGVVPNIVIVPPDADLLRGKIYFLTPEEKTRPKSSAATKTKRKKKEQSERTLTNRDRDSDSSNAAISMAYLQSLSSDRYLTDILSEKLSTQKDRRRGRVAVWRPHLESISESPSDL
ncbi:uncharacterized protein LOC129304671 [Prosopis cineraria]|uniref:uncharacterized protein LOC129304671 n=1 Tax=Prosopis cineraria TaxID=364024 RepID=UPI00240E9FFC|nr:uncharacterized protein LOC129304671 [Prosopis cineraria]